ncbi:MAG TPA: DUF4158 domain-containing protein, partial [Stenomitos sp.]
MPSIAETAYPRLKSQVTSRELQEVYTPTPQELKLAHRYTRGAVAQLGFLVLLKTFQRLGYFVLVKSVPAPIIKHIAQSAQLALSPQVLVGYDTSGTRWRHLSLIRDYLKIKPYGAAARRVIVQSMAQAAFSKNDLADLINVAIEELVRQQYELPVFNTLARVAKRVRTTVERTFYQEVAACLDVEARARLDSLFELEPLHPKTLWHELKLDPGKPMLKHLQELVWRLQWLDELNVNCPALADIPDVKVKHFAAEAMTLDAARMKSLEPYKRYTLAASLLAEKKARTLDDLAEMFIKRMLKIHSLGKEALEQYRQEHLSRTDRLITTLRDLALAYKSDGEIPDRFAAMDEVIGEQCDQVLEECEAHLACAGNNYFPFLWRFYRSH